MNSIIIIKLKTFYIKMIHSIAFLFNVTDVHSTSVAQRFFYITKLLKYLKHSIICCNRA